MSTYQATIPFQADAAVFLTVDAENEDEALEKAHEAAHGVTVTVTFDPDFVDHDAVTTRRVDEGGDTISRDEAMRLMGG